MGADGMANPKMLKPTHHQFTHNAEMLMALSFAFPYCQLPDKLLFVTFCLLQSGAWFNPIAYWIMTKTGCPNPMMTPDFLPPGDKSDPMGDNNEYTQLVMFSSRDQQASAYGLA